MKNYNGKPLCVHKSMKNQLQTFSKICKKDNITFWLDYGTLLGAVRNNKFIPWDYDFDVGIFFEDVDRVLTKENIEIARKMGVGLIRARCGSVDTYDLNYPIPGIVGSVHGDAFAWHTKGDRIFHPWQPHSHNLADVQTFSEIEFECDIYPCFNDNEKVLIQYYGTDWKIPKVFPAEYRECKLWDADNTELMEEIKKYL